MDFHQNTQPEEPNKQPGQPTSADNAQIPGNNGQNMNSAPGQNRQPYGGNPYQNDRPNQNNMPYGNQNSYYYGPDAYHPPITEPGSNFAMTSMILGIISLLTFTMVYPPLILGSLAIVFALLSKGSRPKLLRKARLGIQSATTGIIVAIILIVYSVTSYFTDPDCRAEVNQIYESQYGMSLDEMIEEILEESGY